MTHIKKVLVESTGFSSLKEIVSMSFCVEIPVVLKLSFAISFWNGRSTIKVLYKVPKIKFEQDLNIEV